MEPPGPGYYVKKLEKHKVHIDSRAGEVKITTSSSTPRTR
jgi:hypothetical protein